MPDDDQNKMATRPCDATTQCAQLRPRAMRYALVVSWVVCSLTALIAISSAHSQTLESGPSNAALAPTTANGNLAEQVAEVSAAPMAVSEHHPKAEPPLADTEKTPMTKDDMVLDMRPLPGTQQPTSSEPEPESALVVAYEQAIAALEREEGPYSATLPEQMLGLGSVLQQLNRHQEAIDVFKRGAHLARISGGLYSADQIAPLRHEIRSHLAMGNFSEVDARQEYLYRVERRSLANTIESAYALLRQADWQQQAFIAGIGEEERLAGRLIVMWDLYRLSMSELMELLGETSPELRKPLTGMLRTQYLIAGHQRFQPDGPKRDPTYVLQTGDRYRRGETVLKAIAELGTLNKAPIIQVIDDKLALGDWAWWFNKRTEALAFYDETQRYVTDTKDPTAADYLASALAQPVPLPMIEGIEALPTPHPGDGGELVVAFQVTETGRATDIERLRVPDVEQDEKAIDRLLRALRDVRFRPRFHEGQPVFSDTIIWSWNPEAWRGEVPAAQESSKR